MVVAAVVAVGVGTYVMRSPGWDKREHE